MRIAHASINENKTTKNGQAGDQTGKEVCVRSWYSKPWTILLRYPDRSVRQRIAEIAEILANDNLIGYDQNERNSLHDVLKACDYDLNTFFLRGQKVETDCSAFVTCVCIAAGIKGLEYAGNAPTTATMKSVFKKSGFEVLTDEKYVTQSDYLSEGDILLKPSSHTVIVLDDGDKYGKTSISYFPPCESYHGSIVDALKSIGVDSSKDNRRKIYKANFTDKYIASGKQNRDLLKKLKDGNLIRP